MKIGVDVRSALGNKTGVGFYTYNVIRALSKIDRENEYYLYTTEEFDWGLGNNFHTVLLSNDGVKGKFKDYYEIWTTNEYDLFFGTNFSSIILFLNFFSIRNRKVVLAVHDVVPFYMWSTTNYHTRLRALFLPIAGYLSNKIVTISNATKEGFVKLFKIRENKITITPLAAGEEYFKQTTKEDIERVRTKYKLPRKYFLFVSTLEPRKNIPNLIKGFSKFSKKDKQGIKLVIGGKKGWLYEDIFKVVKEEGVEDKVIFTDYIPDEDMLPLYKGALGFTFVPLMEGFGLTPLEAMATGIPVITSNCSSLPEVTGEAALLTDPKDIEGIAENIRKLSEDEELRKEMIRKGAEQVKKFSWDKTAKLTLDVFKSFSL